MKTKSIPVMIALLAGLITCIMAFMNGTDMGQFVKIFLLVIIGFYILGSIIRLIFDKNFKPLEEEEDSDKSGQEELSGPESGVEQRTPQGRETPESGVEEDE